MKQMHKDCVIIFVFFVFISPQKSLILLEILPAEFIQA